METFVVDTNVLLSDGMFFKKMSGKLIIVPLVVVEELDKHKTSPGDVGANARSSIRYIEDAAASGDLYKGVKTKDGVKIKVLSVPKVAGEKNDDTIVRTTKKAGKTAKLLSNDAHCRIKAGLLRVKAVKHSKDIFSKENELYSGLTVLEVSDDLVDALYSEKELMLEEFLEFNPNSYVLLRSRTNESHTGIVRIIGDGVGHRVSPKQEAFGIKARNLEQSCALDMLMDVHLPLVSLVGSAGSGKTLLALAAALELVINKRVYEKLIVIRPPIPMGKDIGYVPGSRAEKMAVWSGPIMDNVEVLLKNDPRSTFELLVERGQIEIEPPTFIRGRSLRNAIIIVDEAQSLTLHEVKTLVTRVGEQSKLIMTGDIHQIDNPKISAEDNGLTELVEAFKPYDLSGHVTLSKGERSDLATIAAQIL